MKITIVGTGYVGLVTLLLAVYASIRDLRRAHVPLLVVACVLAYLLVLGPSTPIFRAARRDCRRPVPPDYPQTAP